MKQETTNIVVSEVEQWLSSIVIGLNLCPFAQREYRLNRIRFKVAYAKNEQELVRDLVVELSLLAKRDEIETTLLILPYVLDNFLDFNDFLGFAENLLEEMQLDGTYQLASFHPDYQFAGTDVDDAENYTNRAPYPILHILRESSLTKAIEQHANTEQIPQDNIRLMQTLGGPHMRNLLNACKNNRQP